VGKGGGGRTGDERSGRVKEEIASSIKQATDNGGQRIEEK